MDLMGWLSRPRISPYDMTRRIGGISKRHSRHDEQYLSVMSVRLIGASRLKKNSCGIAIIGVNQLDFDFLKTGSER